jgi:hypothetical protein
MGILKSRKKNTKWSWEMPQLLLIIELLLMYIKNYTVFLIKASSRNALRKNIWN